MNALFKKEDTPVLLPENLRPFRPYTPDYAKLCQHQWLNCFFYGEEMDKRWRNNLLIADVVTGVPIRRSEYQAPAYTRMLFSLWVKQLGEYSYPVALGYNFPRTYPLNPMLHIKGEIWKVSPKRVAELDNLRQNGVQFKRIRTLVDIPYRRTMWTKRWGVMPVEHCHKQLWVWMYVGMPDYYNEELTQDMYKPADQFLPKNPRVPEHYFFKTTA